MAFSCHNGWLDRKGDEEPERKEKGFVEPSTIAHSSTCPIKYISCTFIPVFVQESSFKKAGNGWERKKMSFFPYKTWECSKVGVRSERLQNRGFGKRRQKKVSMSSPLHPLPPSENHPLFLVTLLSRRLLPPMQNPPIHPPYFPCTKLLRTPPPKKGGEGKCFHGFFSFDKKF